MKLGIVNLNSLFNKVNFVTNLLSVKNVDVLGINETWLTPSIGNSFVDIPGYHIERSDSTENLRKHGVAFYIRNGIKYSVIAGTPNNTIVVYLSDFDFYIVNVYMPPSNTLTDNQSLVEFIFDFCSEREVALVGDFNLPSVDWIDEHSSHGVAMSDLVFLDAFTTLGFIQIVCESTIYPSGNILDLILLSHAERLGDHEVLAPLPGCDHCPVITDYVFQDRDFQPNANENTNIFLWGRGKYNLFYRCLQVMDWEYELQLLSPNE